MDETDDAVDDLVAALHAFRAFATSNPMLFEVMYAKPFVDFDPGPEESRVGIDTREFPVGRVRRGVEAGVLGGDPTDVAHGLLALTCGLAAQELAGWMGTPAASTARRWDVAITAFVDGLRR